ncbi:hypothetical protein FQZ97_1266700 [compost metagenome]
MPLAHHHLPVMLTNAQAVAITQAPITLGQWRDIAAITTKAHAIVLDGLGIPSGTSIEVDALRGCCAPTIGHQHPAIHVLAKRHPQRAPQGLG